jgi:hypothetical protein
MVISGYVTLSVKNRQYQVKSALVMLYQVRLGYVSLDQVVSVYVWLRVVNSVLVIIVNIMSCYIRI